MEGRLVNGEKLQKIGCRRVSSAAPSAEAILPHFLGKVHHFSARCAEACGLATLPSLVLPLSRPMSDISVPSLFAAFAAAFLAGAVNSVAGGGTLISFPVLLALGLPPVVANATNTVGIWPGAFGSMWGFRKEIARLDRRIFWLLLPALVGGWAGAMLLRSSSTAVFERVAPWLVLFATFLFMIQASLQKHLQTTTPARRLGWKWLLVGILIQLGIAVYGGYFGAGISIMALSVLGLLGMTDMLEMSATTSLLSFTINGVAGVLFVATGLVHWPIALAMAVGALAGGYGATGVARRIGKLVVRRFVICVGATISAVLFVRLLR